MARALFQGWRSRRRASAISHWPPVEKPRIAELLGGRTRRELTRAQRTAIAGLIEHHTGAYDDEALRADVDAVIEGREPPSRRIHRLLRVARAAAEQGAAP